MRIFGSNFITQHDTMADKTAPPSTSKSDDGWMASRSKSGDRSIISTHDCPDAKRASCKVCVSKALQVIKGCLDEGEAYTITPQVARRTDASSLFGTF
jgi:hypothetical protein